MTLDFFEGDFLLKNLPFANVVSRFLQFSKAMGDFPPAGRVFSYFSPTMMCVRPHGQGRVLFCKPYGI